MSAPVTVDLERWGRIKIVIGMLCALVIGGGALVAAATGSISGGTVAIVIAVGFGVIILVLGLGISAFVLIWPPRAAVTLAANGVVHTMSGRPDWRLAWPDISAASVVHTDARVEPGGLSNTGGYLHTSTDVTVARDWLRLTPVPTAATRPDVARALRGCAADDDPATIALDLGPDPRNGQAIHAALAQFARQR